MGIFAAAAAWLVAGCSQTQNTFQGNTGAVIIFLSPANAPAGGGDFILTVNGQLFTDKTVVQWNGSDRKTTFVSSVQITAEIKAADIAAAGQAVVGSFTPQTGSGLNGLSNTVVFVINPPPNPLPLITSISPTSATAGGPAFTLTVAGSGFLTGAGGSVVHWNPAGGSQTNLPADSVSSSQITVTIPASLIASAGTAIVSVSNPPASNGGGGGGPSNGQTFTINPGPVAAQGASADSPALSADGRYVAFVSDSGGHAQVFVRDTCEGAALHHPVQDAAKGCEAKTTLVSANLEGVAAAGDSRAPSISADGRYVAFESDAKDLSDLLPAGRQVFVRDTCAGAALHQVAQGGAADCQPSTRLVSIDDSGALTGNDNGSPAISASGRFVAFVSVTPARGPAPYDAGRGPDASGSGAGSAAGQKNSGFRQVFVRDTCLGAALHHPVQDAALDRMVQGATECTPKTMRISLHPGDPEGSGGESAPLKPAISGSGKKLALPGPVANIFTRSVAIDDRAFLALTDSPR